jgi:hypothetical protein
MRPTDIEGSRLIVAIATMFPLSVQQALATEIPQFDHVVVVILENHAYSEIAASAHAPYLNATAKDGVVFDQSFAISHPGEPNYFALFSGSTQGIRDDGRRYRFDLPDLAMELKAAGKDFIGFVETGSPREHNP